MAILTSESDCPSLNRWPLPPRAVPGETLRERIDLIVMAASGVLILYGDEDRPPIRMSVPQAYLHACADAAGAALIAYYDRLNTGLGQPDRQRCRSMLVGAGGNAGLKVLGHHPPGHVTSLDEGPHRPTPSRRAAPSSRGC